MNPTRFLLLFVGLLTLVDRYELVGAKECTCSDKENPVCGSDGITYKNACQFKCCTNKTAYINHEGKCAKEGNFCPDACLPICGTDGTTYCNDYFAKLAGVCEELVQRHS